MDLTKEQQPIIFDEPHLTPAHHRPERNEQSLKWGRCPQTPGFSALLPSQVDFFMSRKLRMANHPQPGPAPESALGLRPRIALSSAQVA